MSRSQIADLLLLSNTDTSVSLVRFSIHGTSDSGDAFVIAQDPLSCKVMMYVV
jgi:hypothetical protein